MKAHFKTDSDATINADERLLVRLGLQGKQIRYFDLPLSIHHPSSLHHHSCKQVLYKSTQVKTKNHPIAPDGVLHLKAGSMQHNPSALPGCDGGWLRLYR